MASKTEITRIEVSSPDDMSGLEEFLAREENHDAQIMGIIAQNEGDVFARGFTLHRLEEVLASHLGVPQKEVADTIPLLMIGLAGMGLICPHLIVFTRHHQDTGSPRERGMSVGAFVTDQLPAESYGTMDQVRAVVDGVGKALEDSGIQSLDDVHCVYVKVPELTPARKADASRRGLSLDDADYRNVAARSRGAAALGAGIALGDIPASEVTEQAICERWDLYSDRVHVSSGIENLACKVLVIGNAEGVSSPVRVGHGVMRDALDVDGMKNALRSAGLEFDCCPSETAQKRVRSIFVKTSVNRVESIRGRRHTMQTDILWSSAGAQAKAAEHAIAAGLVGDTMVLACSGAEHQGQPGSNLVTAFVES